MEVFDVPEENCDEDKFDVELAAAAAAADENVPIPVVEAVAVDWVVVDGEVLLAAEEALVPES
jgi:hypothetical protein